MRLIKGERATNRHLVLYGITSISAVLAIGFLIVSVAVFRSAPAQIKDQPFWSALKDIGPAIAGSWVLCAALLAITAAGITAIATLNDSAEHARQRRDAIIRVCIGEIKAFWDQCNRLELDAKLLRHIEWLERDKDNPTDLGPFRRAFGDDWFVFFRVDPEALGVLRADASSLYISLSARCRHLASRLNFLNSSRWDTNDVTFWISYHKDTRELLRGLYGPTREMAKLLETSVDPETFLFAPLKPTIS